MSRDVSPRVVPVDSAPADMGSMSPMEETTTPIEFADEVMVVSSFQCWFLWCTVLLVLTFNAALLGVFTFVYMQNKTHDSLLWLFRIYFLFRNSNDFLMKYSIRVALSYAILCGLYSIAVVRMVSTSICKRKVRFLSPKRRRHDPTRLQSTCNTSYLLQCIRSTISRLNKLMEAIGIRSPLFDTRLLAEEVIQLSSQTVAAYTASQSITNVKLNTVYAIVLFINSTSTFVFRHVFKTSLLRQRLASVMTTLLLNFVWGSLLPIWMYVPLVQIYLNRADEIGSLKSFTNSSREVERVLVVAWVNYVMSILPFCLSLFSLLEVNDILYELSSSTFDTKHEQPQGANLVKPQYSVGRMDHGLIFRSVRRSIPLLGLTVLFISAAAHGVFKPIQGSNNTLCMNRVYPWFSSKEACVGRQIDCAVLGIYGSKTELEDVFGGFDRQSLCDLYLYNCSKLEIPSAISKFRQLMLIVIGGGHLYEWGDSANISFQSFPNLHAIQMYNVTIGKDPIGLTGREPISPIVEWIHLEHVDGSRILSLVGINWPNIQTLDCIHCGLSEVPSVFENIPTLIVAVLAHNNISVIRDDWLASTDAQLQMLWLTGNMMLTELPNDVWRQAATAGLFELSLTNLSTVPRWVRDEAAPDFVLTAVGTPVCSTRNQTLLPSQVICSGVSYLGYDA